MTDQTALFLTEEERATLLEVLDHEALTTGSSDLEAVLDRIIDKLRET